MPRKLGSNSRILTRYGDWYIIRRDGSSALYRARIRPGTNTEERVSLRTGDIGEAQRRLIEWLDAQYRPVQAAPADVALAWVIGNYYQEHASRLPSAHQAQIELRYWLDWWKEATVADMTVDRVELFISHLRGLRTKAGAPFSDSSVSRILSSGRAALRRAWLRKMLVTVPHIPDVQTEEDRLQRAPKGRPLTAAEIARILDAIPDESEHLWRFCVLILTTMCRPDAALELSSNQVDLAAGIVRLNPDGRRQTKKRRPIVPVCQTLRPWLERWGQGRYVTYTPSAAPGASRMKRTTAVHVEPAPVASIKTAWRALRARVWPADLSGLPEPTTPAERRARRLMCGPQGENVQPYSIRHTMGRVLRRARVSGDEIAVMLGHKIVTESAVTAVYSPHDPDYCRAAVEAIDAFCLEVSRLQRGRRRLVSGAPALRLASDT
jgi:integrase